ncbi:helix-turn-helix transcriptional regulator [Polymorphospora rubra]|uniref:helix-turn-helix transcriptional regulator n=1 Tax=Polymorphospora rubra TaxID=338584 RepID=UPI0033F99803
MDRDWPLVGRGEELRSIEAAIRSGTPHGVLLAGPAGVGKTRLAREVLNSAERRGAVTRWVVGTEPSRGLPLGAFAALLGALSGDPTALVAQASRVLVADAGDGPVVLGVDDAHLLDEMSALLVHQLVLHSAAVVVATVRTGETVPDLITHLWKDGYLDRLEVSPLEQRQTGSLLEAALGGPVESKTVRRVWQITQGNALYLRHFVDGEIEADRLRPVRGVWRWSGGGVSPGLTDLVTIRMGELAEPVATVVDLLALAEPLGVRLLARLADPAAIEQAERAGLVRAGQDGRRLEARLTHPLFGEVRRARMGVLRARRLRGRISRAIADTGSRRADDTLRRAVLALDSDLEPDRRLLLAAASRAGQLCDLPLTVRLGQAAQAAGGGFEAHMITMAALNGLSRPAGAEAAALAATAGTDDEVARATVAQVLNLAWMALRPAQAEAILAAAEARIVGDPGRTRLMALRALFDGQRARPARAIEAATAALAAPDLPDESAALAATGYVVSLATVGRADELADATARGLSSAGRSAEFGYVRFPLLTSQLTGLRLAGYLREAADIAYAGWESVRGLDLPALISTVLVGDITLAQGRPVSALRWLREAHAGLERFGEAGGFEHVCLIPLGRALALTGDLTAAADVLARLRTRQHPMVLFLRPDLVLSHAWLAAAQGVSSEAITLAHEAASIAATTGQFAHEVLALHTAVCFGDRSVAGRLTTLADRVDGPRAPAAATHATALAADDGDGLWAASDLLERMGDPLAAADAAAQAEAAYRRVDRRGAAHRAAARVHRLTERCEGVRTLATSTTVQPLPLTGREREIGGLAARGMTNREIAHRLVVSVRTIENHLYRINAKLGTGSRAELAEVFHEEMPVPRPTARDDHDL